MLESHNARVMAINNTMLTFIRFIHISQVHRHIGSVVDRIFTLLIIAEKRGHCGIPFSGVPLWCNRR